MATTDVGLVPTTGYTSLPEVNTTEEKNCTLEADSLLRPILFTYAQLRGSGLIVINCLITLYIFVLLAVISWKFFVPAVEKLTKDLNVTPSVAGAILMAMGVSVPNFACIVVGTFVAHNDVGLGGVLGGAMYNIFCVPAFCGMVMDKGWIRLSPWPTIRDMLCLSAASLILLVCTLDEKISIEETMFMLISYVAYMLLVIYSGTLARFARGLIGKWKLPPVLCRCRVQEDPHSATEDTGLIQKDGLSVESAGSDTSSVKSEKSDTEVEYTSLLSPPTDWKLLPWLLFSPAFLVLCLLIPDFQRPGWGRTYLLTILMSMIVIAGLSYILIWMISIIGNTSRIPVTVIGMTILAVGSNIPDTFNSIFAAKDGYGEMAVSNAFGSIIFQMLGCLGIPWLVMDAMEFPETVVIKETMIMPLVFLICSGFLSIFILFITRWKINAWVSGLFITIFFIFIIPSVAFQELHQTHHVRLCVADPA